jgi:hypothetical protein
MIDAMDDTERMSRTAWNIEAGLNLIQPATIKL